MELKFKKIDFVCYFDKTFILKIDDGLITLYCNRNYSVASIFPKQSEKNPTKESIQVFNINLPFSYDDLVYLWEAALWYVSKRIDSPEKQSEVKFQNSMSRYIKRALYQAIQKNDLSLSVN